MRALVSSSLTQIQEKVGPAPKPEDIKAFSIVHLYFQASLGAGARHHDGSVHDMPLRHTTSGVQNHPRPGTRGSTTVPCTSRSSAPAHSPAPAASVHPAAPPGLHPLLLAPARQSGQALRQGLRTSMQPAPDTCSPSAASGAVRQAGPAGLQHHWL
jgi:hypothetical protein